MTKEILLVDDNPNDVELALAALAEHGLAGHIVVARDGVEALDYLYRRKQFAGRDKGNPQVVLLDLKMPKVNGLELVITHKCQALWERDAGEQRLELRE
jgi:CheY-like chemotaxis protein